MSTHKLNRRKLLGYASSSILALPFYRLLLETEAKAADEVLRVLFAYIPAGIPASQWFPQGGETNFTLPYIAQPLARLRNDLVIFSGLNTIGPNNHTGGPKQVFAGGGEDGSKLYSLDQRLADMWGAQGGVKRVAMGLGSTQSTDGHLVSYNSQGVGVPTSDNPKNTYDQLFGSFRSTSNALQLVAEQKQDIASGRKRVIDLAMEDFKRIKQLLGNEEKIIYESHVTALDELGKEIQDLIAANNAQGGGSGSTMGGSVSNGTTTGGATTGGTSSGTVPSTATCNPSSADPLMAKMKVDAEYWPLWYHKKENVDPIAKVNRQMMIQAFACGLTRVGLLQFGASNTQMVMHFNGLADHNTMHHLLSHDSGQNFYDVQRKIIEEVVAVAEAFASIKLANGKTLLQQSLIFTSSCIGGNPNNHDGINIPCFTLGQAGGVLRTGRYLGYQGAPYNQLLVSIAQMLGLPVNDIGNKTKAGPLPRLS